MKNVRIRFEKTGTAQYISHLDLTRAMSRALRLSSLPVWYTEGFNPRVYMTFSMPLSLGVRGERELMDIRLTEEVAFPQIVSSLNARLPKDIRAKEAWEPQLKFEAITFAEYELLLESDNADRLMEKLRNLFSRETIPVLKHSKKGDREFDIKPSFGTPEPERVDGGTVCLSLRLPCSVSGSVNPSLLLEALKRYEGEEPWAVTSRKRLLTEDFSEIR